MLYNRHEDEAAVANVYRTARELLAEGACQSLGNRRVVRGVGG
jgi:hypothetical protein